MSEVQYYCEWLIRPITEDLMFPEILDVSFENNSTFSFISRWPYDTREDGCHIIKFVITSDSEESFRTWLSDISKLIDVTYYELLINSEKTYEPAFMPPTEYLDFDYILNDLGAKNELILSKTK
jgi:hypothetical protein